jgi:hypothetical protein
MVPSKGGRPELLTTLPVHRTDVFQQAKCKRRTYRVLDMRAQSEVHQPPLSLRRPAVRHKYQPGHDHADWHRDCQGLYRRVVRDREDDEDNQHDGERDRQNMMSTVKAPESRAPEERTILVGFADQPPGANAKLISGDKAEETCYDGEINPWYSESVSADVGVQFSHTRSHGRAILQAKVKGQRYNATLEYTQYCEDYDRHLVVSQIEWQWRWLCKPVACVASGQRDESAQGRIVCGKLNGRGRHGRGSLLLKILLEVEGVGRALISTLDFTSGLSNSCVRHVEQLRQFMSLPCVTSSC